LHGASILSDLSKSSKIYGIIIFALYTFILSPIPSLRDLIIDKLCTEAFCTVVPSISTGSKTAIGFIKPVLDVFH